MNPATATNPWWAAVVIVVVPLVIITAAEIDERLRQRESPLRRAVTVLRNWSLPAFAVWAVAVPVLGRPNDALVPTVASSLLVVSIAAAALVVLRVLLDGISESRHAVGESVPQLVLATPRIALVLVAAWLLVAGVWGVDLSSALAALGVTSLVISFALQDTLSGLASGMLLLSDQPFQPGDWIQTAEIEGKVLDLNWRTTRIRNRQGDTIIVPNSQLSGASIVNYGSADGKHRVQVDVQVSVPTNPPTLAKAMLLDAARNTPGVLADPEPYVAVTQIDDPLMGYQVHMWIEDYAIEPMVKTDFGTLVWYQSHRHGVPLPSPAQDLYLYDGVAAGQEDTPTPAEIREIISRSQLLVSLGDEDIDRLVGASRLERFSVGEVMVDTRSAATDFMMIAEGRAALTLVEPDGTQTVIDELGAGESVGLLGDAGGGSHLLSKALEDCVVLVAEAAVAAEIGSRQAEVAAAFNRVVTLRRRRVERMLERRLAEQADRP